jgi:AcrR family transcriptional regulator
VARTRSVHFDDQREQILVAAAQLFAAEGYHAATMQRVAAACGVSKATLYHYVRDKEDLLVQISRGHVARLEAIVAQVSQRRLAAAPHLRLLIEQFTAAYASAQNEHRVLTEDMRFLPPAEREVVLAGQRRLVAAFAAAITRVRPELKGAQLDKPLAMLIFGMINWTFTWLRPEGELSHASLAPVVSELFFGGLQAVQAVPAPRQQPLEVT